MMRRPAVTVAPVGQVGDQVAVGAEHNQVEVQVLKEHLRQRRKCRCGCLI